MQDAGTGAKYDVCLSFAGEQRDYVDRVADCLRRASVRLFYDRYETAALWGQDLVQRLDEVFRGQARFCVMFVSADYAAKVWTTHERRSARLLGADHPHTLRTRYSLAQSLGRGGNPTSARELTADLLTDQTRALGAEHPHTLRTRYNLAHWTGAAGDLDGQRAALTTLLEDQGRILGPDHPDTKLTQQALASIG